jgi:hypothetical protein
MFGWFQALMPKEERYFYFSRKHAAIVVAGADPLRGLLRGGGTVEDYCKQTPGTPCVSVNRPGMVNGTAACASSCWSREEKVMPCSSPRPMCRRSSIRRTRRNPQALGT